MSTISNERLEKMAAGGGFNFNEVEAISSELLALRKDRERVVPAAWAHRLVNKHSGVIHPWVYGSAEKSPSEGDVFRIEVMPLYAAPQPVAVPDAATAIRACLDEFPESVHDIVEECAAIAENASRAAMIKSAMQSCEKCGLTGIHACMGSMETDTTSQQFESLAGKAVGGWIPCSERMPDFYYSCLAADEHGDMVIGRPSNLEVSDRKSFCLSNGELFFATHWQPLPEPPCK